MKSLLRLSGSQASITVTQQQRDSMGALAEHLSCLSASMFRAGLAAVSTAQHQHNQLHRLTPKDSDLAIHIY